MPSANRSAEFTICRDGCGQNSSQCWRQHATANNWNFLAETLSRRNSSIGSSSILRSHSSSVTAVLSVHERELVGQEQAVGEVGPAVGALCDERQGQLLFVRGGLASVNDQVEQVEPVAVGEFLQLRQRSKPLGGVACKRPVHQK